MWKNVDGHILKDKKVYKVSEVVDILNNQNLIADKLRDVLVEIGVIRRADIDIRNLILSAETFVESEAPVEFDTYTYEQVKHIATNFFYWWYNKPGSNTEQGFEEYWQMLKDSED